MILYKVHSASGCDFFPIRSSPWNLRLQVDQSVADLGHTELLPTPHLSF